MPQRNIIQLSGITQPQFSSGSLIVTFNELPYDFGSPYIEVINNNRISKRQYTNIDNLYSTFLNIGDTVRIASSTSNIDEYVYVTRLDYTCDDENGDRGIKESYVTSGNTTGTTFTVTGNSNSYNFEYLVSNQQITCYNLGTGFSPSGTTDYVLAIQTDSSSNVYVGGSFTGYSGNASRNFVKTDKFGNIDTSFNIGTGFSYTDTGYKSYVGTIIVQPDSKVIAGGRFNRYNGNNISGIIRLNTNGSVDNTFNANFPDFTAGKRVNDIRLLSDGSMIVVGDLEYITGTTATDIYKLSSTGAVLNTFGTFPNTITAEVYSVDVLSTGKIVAVGDFTSYSGVTTRDIIMFNSDGTLDTSFNSGSGFSGATNTANYFVRVQPDDKIIVGGTFSTYSGVSVNDLIRLNSNGTIDTSFNIGTGSNAWVESFDILPDGKILVVGPFSTWNGNISNQLVRLNSDGSVDNTLSTQTGFNSTTYRVHNDDLTDRIYVGGQFNTYRGLSANHFIRLFSDGNENIC
jgi:uncharacterized delta-60 repeat protein